MAIQQPLRLVRGQQLLFLIGNGLARKSIGYASFRYQIPGLAFQGRNSTSNLSDPIQTDSRSVIPRRGVEAVR
jgi:hypothetical protein